MKKAFFTPLAPIWVIALTLVLSACHKEKKLLLQGVWEEESYWTPTDSLAADTLVHTYTLCTLRFECDQSFRMAQTTYHDTIPSDPIWGAGSYTEYIRGQYTVDKQRIMTLSGRYYTDDSYSVEADSINSPYTNYGDYELKAAYKLDAKRLVLKPTVGTDVPSMVFSQTEALECQ